MAKAYWISAYHSISNPDALAEYAKLAGPAIQAAGGKILARGGRVEAHEAGKNERTVLIEFENFETASGAYSSAGYQAALEKLGPNSVVRDIRIFEGIE